MLRLLQWPHFKIWQHLVLVFLLVVTIHKHEHVGREALESRITTSTNGNSWEIVPANTVAGIILGVLFIYLFFRHFMLILMVMDIFLGWLRKFNWFPKEGKRMKTFVHWVIALVLFLVFLLVAGSAGWLEFIPQ